MERIKDCPFCGTGGHLYIEPLEHYYNNSMYYVQCTNPNCAAMVCHGRKYDVYISAEDARREAIEAWNRRVKD